MLLYDVTNVYRKEGSYTPSCILPAKYRPCIYRGHRLVEQTPLTDFPAKRKAGDTTIDLWLDGSIYPANPRTSAPPPFSDLKSLLCFVGDGATGLLGYVESLHSANDLADRCAELVVLVRSLDTSLQLLQAQFAAERGALVASSAQDRLRYEHHLSSEMARFHNAAILHESQLQFLRESVAGHIADKTRHCSEAAAEVESLTSNYTNKVQHLQTNYESQIRDLNLELLSTKNELAQIKLSHDKRLNMPFNSISGRKKKDLADLSKKGGHTKRVKAAIRGLVQPNTVAEVRDFNTVNGMRKRLCGERNTQITTGAVFAEILSRGEAESMLEAPKFKKVATAITNGHLKKVGKAVGEGRILGVMDVNGIPESAYNALCKVMRAGASEVDKSLKFEALPRPHRVMLLRTKFNSNLRNYIGEYFHLNSSYEMPLMPNEDSRNRTGPIHLHMDDSNNLFVDVEVVQRSMIKHYEITATEIGDAPLIFVLKMDEAEIIKEQKFERVSITLMNRALHTTEASVANIKSFSVQAEGHIWPIGTFRILKESHACLKWVFYQTPLPSIISAQQQGQKLIVENVGEFSVEWHLACDMKTVKCLYGFSHGANAEHACMYCWQKRAKRRTLIEVESREPWKYKQAWSGGLFSRSIQAKPVRGFSGGPNGTDARERKEAIAAMEHCLSQAGLGGGAVVLKRDSKLSGINSDLPSKLSFNGAKCRKMFKKSSWSHFDKVWKDVCEAEQNNTMQGQAKIDRQECWSAFDDLQFYFKAMSLTPEEISAYKPKVERWGKAYVKAFGEGAVTHYVHVLVKHSSWFVQQFGSIAIWSTQGMEKTHYQAKSAYMKYTQHDGTNLKHSAIIQTFEWWYRVIQHREYERERARVADACAVADQLQADVRRQTTLSSTAAEKHRAWVSSRQRVKSRWAPRVPEVHEVDREEVSVAG